MDDSNLNNFKFKKFSETNEIRFFSHLIPDFLKCNTIGESTLRFMGTFSSY
jgi:hypothetical protein